MSSGIKEKETEFRFYGHYPNQKGWRFSNFSNHSLELDGVLWLTSEHYYQAMKFKTTDEAWFKNIIECKTPGHAKKMGNSRNHPLRKDWNDIKDDIMYIAVKTKVEQNIDVKEDLLNTRNKIIIENSKYDSYWGCGKDGKGRNQLGKTLMRIRDEILQDEEVKIIFKYKDMYLTKEESLGLVNHKK